ncbi:MAG: helix-turn-helix domain-containing protein [Nitrospirae bacterium]|nr:helix-turn-helix domain-containing protein [Nitrospirota bacterium]
MNNLGRRLKHLRVKLGISQFELSYRSGISQASIARIETDQQKNLKTETIKKLAEGLGVPVARLLEEPDLLKEEGPAYSTPRMIPVIKEARLKNFRNLSSVIEGTAAFEPALSRDHEAFFLLPASDLVSPPMIDDHDLLLIEPEIPVENGDLVLLLSGKDVAIGKIWRHTDMTTFQPLGRESPPRVLSQGKKRKPNMRIFRVSEIRKKLKK